MGGSPGYCCGGGARGIIVGAWRVHAYVSDIGPHRHVELVAIGDSGFNLAFHGIRNTVSLGKNSEKMAAIAADLQAADRGLRTPLGPRTTNSCGLLELSKETALACVEIFVVARPPRSRHRVRERLD